MGRKTTDGRLGESANPNKRPSPLAMPAFSPIATYQPRDRLPAAMQR